MVVRKTHLNYIAPDEYARRDKAAGIWARDPLDYYIEQPWCSARLFDEEDFSTGIVDPACGSGNIVRSARAARISALGSDIMKRNGGECYIACDFFSAEWLSIYEPTNICCNPPFGVADQFVKLAIERAEKKTAMLLPATWHFGSKRAAWLATTPLQRVLALTPRPSMPPGAVIEAGHKPGGGTKDFSWYIWERGHVGPWEGGWLHRDAPRKVLEAAE